VFADSLLHQQRVPEMFHQLQVIVNELKALGEEVKDI